MYLGDYMIKDISGINLYPGDFGKDCIGNGEHTDEKGNIIPMCCDECDYIMCCISGNTDCLVCKDYDCPRNNAKNTDIQP